MFSALGVSLFKNRMFYCQVQGNDAHLTIDDCFAVNG